MTILMLSAALAAEPAVQTRTLRHLDADYTVVTVRLGTPDADLRLYGGVAGGVYLSEADLQAKAQGRVVVAATNAGMYAPDHGPVGLFVADGEQRHPIALADGPGNFHLKPNGVFWVGMDGAAHVTVSEAYAAEPSTVRLASQSGPMLVIGGEIHPAFRPQSTNFFLRNGVGVSDPSTVHIAISETGVRFHDFATLFRDVLGCPDALFFDGTVSMLWAGEGPFPAGHFAGILAVTRPAPPSAGRADGPDAPKRSERSGE